MATKEEKIKALTDLMTNGILTADEFSSFLHLLSGDAVEKVEPTKTPAEIKYEDYITNHVAYAFKSPAGIKFPKLESSMIHEDTLSIAQGFKSIKMQVRYISTYIDAPNSYGAMLRKEIGIVIDDDFNPQFTIEPIKTFGKVSGWMKMPGVR